MHYYPYVLWREGSLCFHYIGFYWINEKRGVVFGVQ